MTSKARRKSSSSASRYLFLLSLVITAVIILETTRRSLVSPANIHYTGRNPVRNIDINDSKSVLNKELQIMNVKGGNLTTVNKFLSQFKT